MPRIFVSLYHRNNPKFCTIKLMLKLHLVSTCCGLRIFPCLSPEHCLFATMSAASEAAVAALCERAREIGSKPRGAWPTLCEKAWENGSTKRVIRPALQVAATCNTFLACDNSWVCRGEHCPSAGACRQLLSEGAAVNEVSANDWRRWLGVTALQAALLERSCPAVIQVLCDAGASVRGSQLYGRQTMLQLLFEGQKQRHPDIAAIAKTLVAAGADPILHACFPTGWSTETTTPLHDAVLAVDVPLVEVFLGAFAQRGASVDTDFEEAPVPWFDGNEGFDHEVMKESPLLCIWRVLASANVWRWGQAQLQRQCLAMVNLLIWNGANVNRRLMGRRSWCPLRHWSLVEKMAQRFQGGDGKASIGLAICAVLIDEGADVAGCRDPATLQHALLLAGAGCPPLQLAPWCTPEHVPKFIAAIGVGAWRRRSPALLHWQAAQHIDPRCWHPFRPRHDT